MALCSSDHWRSLYGQPLVDFFQQADSWAVETFAYYGRAWSHSDPHSVKGWVLQSMLIFVAPVFLAATVYMALCRIIVAIGAEEHSMIRPRWLAKLYILVDVLVFMSQVAGIGLQITGDKKVMDIGNKAIAGGLAFQFAMLFFFGAIAARVHRRSRTASAREPSTGLSITNVKTTRYFVAMYVAAAAIALRSLVRLIEFAQGERGTIASHEIFLYVFDSAPMLLVMLVVLLVHPGKLIRQRNRRKSTDAVPLVGPWH